MRRKERMGEFGDLVRNEFSHFLWANNPRETTRRNGRFGYECEDGMGPKRDWPMWWFSWERSARRMAKGRRREREKPSQNWILPMRQRKKGNDGGFGVLTMTWPREEWCKKGGAVSTQQPELFTPLNPSHPFRP
jgi:hypothetical protein